MTTLARELRKELEKTAKKARRVAEAGARKVVEQLAVQHHEPWGSMTPEQRALRNRLRAHGRQLGDRRDEKRGTQAIGRLVQECAYEHWHRMLFARFLAETDLLIERQSGVAITLGEVQELAREQSADWLELASDYAERMLPQIFRKGDPVLDIALPPETRSELEDLLKQLPHDVFLADDSLGWIYQFWQADRKDEVNKSETKIGADELAAVTQLFTEDYMVLFLLHNTLGAWWAGKVLSSRPEFATSAKYEDELRAACKVGDVDWTYLRFIRDGVEGPWRPAAGAFGGWPKAAKDVTVLDPCMGSGHFLVFALPILVAFRMAEESLSREAAVDAVLRDNLFGLEIDPRCTQIAAFNLAFAAWRMVRYRPLPRLSLACSGLAIGVTKAEWLKLAERAAEFADPAAKRDIFGLEKNLITAGISERAKNGLERLYDLFAKAPWLGSLIDPRSAGGDIFSADFAQLEPLLAPILTAAGGDEIEEMVVAAQGMAKAAEILASKFTLVATNVPFLVRSKQDEVIRSYCESHQASAKADLSTCMLDRCSKFASATGTFVAVIPQNWLFLKAYEPFRKVILDTADINIVGVLGMAAFEIMDWWAFNTILFAASNHSQRGKNQISKVGAGASRDIDEKKSSLIQNDVLVVSQDSQRKNPDCIINFEETDESRLLSKYAECFQGISPGDGARLVRSFWEMSSLEPRWRPFQGPPTQTIQYCGREEVIDWQTLEKGFDGSAIRGREAWEKRGIAVGQMRNLPATLYEGTLFSNSTPVIIPKREQYLPALWAFCSSQSFSEEIRKINPKISVDNGYVSKISFDYTKWNALCSSGEDITLSKPHCSDPTQWLFSGSPRLAKNPLQVGITRLLGWLWPRQTGSSFMDCPGLDLDGLAKHADDDGIVCLTAIKGEAPAEQHLNALLADAFSADWSAAKLAGLLAEVGFAGKTLDDWLRDGFFQQHCELFHQRPFVWHIWDGRRDGFHALVNYHRLAAPGGEGRRTLEKLIYSYLGDWIDRQHGDQKAGVDGADGRLAAGEHLRAELTKILEGEPPYDIFVRWKPLREQPIGWEPDINDGVRVNIRPFMTARPLSVRGANACILRTTPKNLKWDKDRGKEPTREKADYPWFWGWDEAGQDFPGGKDFDGNRWNDLHYSRAVKQTARDLYRAQVEKKSGGRK